MRPKVNATGHLIIESRSNHCIKRNHKTNQQPHVNKLYKQGLLISEQQVIDNNPLFYLATVPRDLQATSPNSSSQLVAPGTHTTG